MHRTTLLSLCGRLTLALSACGLPVLSLAAEPRPAVAVCRPGEIETADHDFTGRIGPDDPVEIRAPATGIVQKVSIRAGDTVRKGDVLFKCQWAEEFTGDCPLAVAVRESEAELKRWTEAVEEAGKLAKNAPDDLAKEYEAASERLKDRLDSSLKSTAPILQQGLSPTRRDEARKLYEALERTLRLAKVRREPSVQPFYEGELTRLRPTVVRATSLSENWGKGEKARQFTADLPELQKALDRATLLSRARSKEGLDTLAAERDLAAATLKSARDDLETARRTLCSERIVAPTAGRVLRVGAVAGDRVEAAARSSTLLCVIAPTSSVRVAFDIDEATLELLQQLARAGKLPVKSLADVTVRLGLPAEDEYPHAGTLAYLDNRLDPGSHRLRCRAAFPNANGALTNAAFARDGKGETVRVRMPLGESKKVLLVPRQSVLTDAEGKAQVLVIDDKNRVEARTVRTGGDYGSLRAVEEGLRATDWAVVGPADAGKGTADAALKPGDFVRDLRLLNLKPGTIVEPLHVALPDSDGAERPKR